MLFRLTEGVLKIPHSFDIGNLCVVVQSSIIAIVGLRFQRDIPKRLKTPELLKQELEEELQCEYPFHPLKIHK